MYQFDESTKSAILQLNNQALYETIIDQAAKITGGNISICFPLRAKEKNKIHFIIEGQKQLSSRNKIDLGIDIEQKLGFDSMEENDTNGVFIDFKDMYSPENFNELFTDVTLLSKNDFKTFQKFLFEHYKSFFPHAKLQSTYISSSPSTEILLSNHKVDILTELDEIDPNELIELLKTNPKIFNTLSRSPDALDKLVEPIKKKLREENKSSVIPTIPVE